MLYSFWHEIIMVFIGNFPKSNHTILSIAASIWIVIVPIFFSLFGAELGSNMDRAVAITLSIIVQFILFAIVILGAIIEGDDFWLPLFIILLAHLCCMIVYTIFNNLIDEQTTLKRIINIERNKIDFIVAGFCTSLLLAFRLFLNIVAQKQWVEPIEIVAVGAATIASLAVTAIPLLEMIVFKPRRILAKYRKLQANSIKP